MQVNYWSFFAAENIEKCSCNDNGKERHGSIWEENRTPQELQIIYIFEVGPYGVPVIAL